MTSQLVGNVVCCRGRPVEILREECMGRGKYSSILCVSLNCVFKRKILWGKYYRAYCIL